MMSCDERCAFYGRVQGREGFASGPPQNTIILLPVAVKEADRSFITYQAIANSTPLVQHISV